MKIGPLQTPRDNVPEPENIYLVSGGPMRLALCMWDYEDECWRAVDTGFGGPRVSWPWIEWYEVLP